ncbi:MAG TPA: hypothetical protein VNZ53_52345 [Steroidobacteraceae bacterium]|nr:hypothetical protein [Steroidobacteraceae bacterium]
MYIDTTAPKVLSPKHFHSLDRCSPVIIDTSALNCSANSVRTASASDSGSFTATSAGSGGNDNACAHTRRTSPATRPSPGLNATNRVS